MDRRQILALLATAGCALTTGCDDDSDARQERLMNNVKNSAGDIRSALDTLKSTVKGFETQDWRDVVKDVEDNVSDLDKAVTSLEDIFDPTGP
jgi:hypothetical protein